MEEKVKDKAHYFYVLWCKDNSLYGGYTTNLSRREEEHNLGQGAKYTKPKNRRPLKMIYAETFSSRSDATSAEYHFKKLTRIKKEKYLESQGVSFPLETSNKIVVNDKREGGLVSEKPAKFS